MRFGENCFGRAQTSPNRIFLIRITSKLLDRTLSNFTWRCIVSIQRYFVNFIKIAMIEQKPRPIEMLKSAYFKRFMALYALK